MVAPSIDLAAALVAQQPVKAAIDLGDETVERLRKVVLG
jgi:hypothetical protein